MEVRRHQTKKLSEPPHNQEKQNQVALTSEQEHQRGQGNAQMVGKEKRRENQGSMKLQSTNKIGLVVDTDNIKQQETESSKDLQGLKNQDQLQPDHYNILNIKPTEVDPENCTQTYRPESNQTFEPNPTACTNHYETQQNSPSPKKSKQQRQEKKIFQDRLNVNSIKDIEVFEGCGEVIPPILFSNLFDYEKIIGQGAFGVVAQAEKVTTIKDFLKENEYVNENSEILVMNAEVQKVWKKPDDPILNQRDRNVAIKLINKRNLNKEEYNQLKNEAVILKEMNHPNITKFYDIYETGAFTFIEMELIRGGNLSNFIKQSKDKMSDKMAAKIMKGLLSAVEHVHQKNFVHRDLKPDNVLLGDPEKLDSVKLADFGLSAQIKINFEEALCEDIGTLLYMAPEQTRNQIYGKRIDMWACGIIMYMLVSGNHPLHEPELDTKEIFLNKLKNPKFTFNDKFTDMSKDFFQKLCNPNSLDRYTADKALKHPWITRDFKAKKPLTTSEEIGEFQIELQLRRIVQIGFFMSAVRNNNVTNFEETKSKKSTASENRSGKDQKNKKQEPSQCYFDLQEYKQKCMQVVQDSQSDETKECTSEERHMSGDYRNNKMSHEYSGDQLNSGDMDLDNKRLTLSVISNDNNEDKPQSVANHHQKSTKKQSLGDQAQDLGSQDQSNSKLQQTRNSHQKLSNTAHLNLKSMKYQNCDDQAHTGSGNKKYSVQTTNNTQVYQGTFSEPNNHQVPPSQSSRKDQYQITGPPEKYVQSEEHVYEGRAVIMSPVKNLNNYGKLPKPVQLTNHDFPAIQQNQSSNYYHSQTPKGGQQQQQQSQQNSKAGAHYGATTIKKTHKHQKNSSSQKQGAYFQLNLNNMNSANKQKIERQLEKGYNHYSPIRDYQPPQHLGGPSNDTIPTQNTTNKKHKKKQSQQSSKKSKTQAKNHHHNQQDSFSLQGIFEQPQNQQENEMLIQMQSNKQGGVVVNASQFESNFFNNDDQKVDQRSFQMNDAVSSNTVKKQGSTKYNINRFSANVQSQEELSMKLGSVNEFVSQKGSKSKKYRRGVEAQGGLNGQQIVQENSTHEKYIQLPLLVEGQSTSNVPQQLLMMNSQGASNGGVNGIFKHNNSLKKGDFLKTKTGAILSGNNPPTFSIMNQQYPSSTYDPLDSSDGHQGMMHQYPKQQCNFCAKNLGNCEHVNRFKSQLGQKKDSLVDNHTNMSSNDALSDIQINFMFQQKNNIQNGSQKQHQKNLGVNVTKSSNQYQKLDSINQNVITSQKQKLPHAHPQKLPQSSSSGQQQTGVVYHSNQSMGQRFSTDFIRSKTQQQSVLDIQNPQHDDSQLQENRNNEQFPKQTSIEFLQMRTDLHPDNTDQIIQNYGSHQTPYQIASQSQDQNSHQIQQQYKQMLQIKLKQQKQQAKQSTKKQSIHQNTASSTINDFSQTMVYQNSNLIQQIPVNQLEFQRDSAVKNSKQKLVETALIPPNNSNQYFTASQSHPYHHQNTQKVRQSIKKSLTHKNSELMGQIDTQDVLKHKQLIPTNPNYKLPQTHQQSSIVHAPTHIHHPPQADIYHDPNYNSMGGSPTTKNRQHRYLSTNHQPQSKVQPSDNKQPILYYVRNLGASQSNTVQPKQYS